MHDKNRGNPAGSGRYHNLSTILLSTLCLLLLVSLAFAQSGRRQKRSTPEPPPQGVKMPAEKTEAPIGHSDSDDAEAEEKKEKAPAFRILVGTAMQDNFNVPMMYSDVARDGCLSELKRNPLVQVTAANNMTRGEAIEAAKKDDKLYVLWMELIVDRFTANTRDGFDLRFMIFEPGTARVIGNGSGYPAQTTGLPLPTIGMNSAQYRVHLAGRDVARQAMSRLNIEPKGRFPYAPLQR